MPKAKILNKRLDGWFNLLSGLGMKGRDKRVESNWEYSKLNEIDVETLYASDDISAKIVDLLPEDALREWIEIKNMSDQVVEDAISYKFDTLGARQRLEEGWKWGRLYGGAGVYMTIEDGMDPQEPVKEDRIYEIKSLTTLNRYELVPYQINSNLDSPYFGQPEIYRLQTSQPTDFVERYIHRTRLLRFEGVSLPRRLRIQNQWWGDSVLTRSLNAIRNYNSTHDSAVSALQDFSVGVFQIKNLAEMISSGQEDVVRKRLEIMNYSKSVIKSVVMDLEEKFEHQSKSLSGVPEVMKQANSRLVVASGMPHTKILGESPSGLGADGKSEQRDWYDYVKNNQKIVLRPIIETLFRYIFLSKNGPTGGKIPDEWAFEFNPLWQLSDLENAQMQFIVAQKDQIYLQNQVVDPDEIAKSRFGGEKYSMDTVIDRGARDTNMPPISSTAEGSGESQDKTNDPLPVNPANNNNIVPGENTPASGYVSRSDGKSGRVLQSIVRHKDGKSIVTKIRDASGMSGFKSFKSPSDDSMNFVYGSIEHSADGAHKLQTPHTTPESPDEFEQHNLNMQSLWSWEQGPECGPDGKGCLPLQL